MDTKWKKSKIIFSFAAFFLGMTLFINSLLSLISIAVSSRGTVFDQNSDYQNTAAFRYYISDYLETLLGIATGGKGWEFYGPHESYEDIVYNDILAENYDIFYGTGDTAVIEEAAEGYPEDYLNHLEEQLEAEAWESQIPEEAYANPDSDLPAHDWRDNYQSGYWPISSEKNFMRNVSQNKNLRYAIVYENTLVYTNIDGLESKTGKSWDNLDFETLLSPEEYNFTLWFNKDKDSKTRIFRDGAEIEIYGNGMYSKDKRWFVPGYTNFNVDKATEDAVIFLAVAREPKLYVTGNYSEYGTNQYGGQLYSICENLRETKKEFRKNGILFGLSLFLLLLSFCFRKERRLAKENIGRLTGKLWLEFKVLAFFIFPLALFSYRTLTLIRYNADYFDHIWEAWSSMSGNHVRIIICFWLLYLGFLDKKVNKGHQKKPLVTGLRSGDLYFPIQKRMVRRYRLTMAVWLTVPLLGFMAFFLPARGYLKWAFTAYPLPFFLFLLAYLSLGAVSVLYLKKNRRLAEDLGAFFRQVDSVREGDLTEPLTLPVDTDLADATESLNSIQHGLETALQEKLRSEQMKVELVTNVSHDIKTPLTSIISYVELLKQEEALPDHVKEFIQILGEKSERLKTIVQDVFDVSKAASGQLPIEPEKLDLVKLLQQTLADMNSQIERSRLSMRLSIPEEPVFIFADGSRLYRVFQNLIQNALTHSLEGSRIFLSLKTEGCVALVTIRNTSASELDKTVDFSERFVRGDVSRTDGGSGLGLSIAKSFTEACGGSLRITTDADLFTVTVAFPTC